jgi:hypothetical protein
MALPMISQPLKKALRAAGHALHEGNLISALKRPPPAMPSAAGVGTDDEHDDEEA